MVDKADRLSGPVVVDGATGYVGSHLVSRLVARGHRVRCVVRPSSAPADLDFLRSAGAEIVAADLNAELDDETARPFAGAATAVHLIGSIAPAKGETLDMLHAGQTRGLVERCQRCGVEKIVMVTALGTGPHAASAYHRTKWQAEELVSASGLEYVILRPSLVVGRLVGRRDSKLVRRYAQIIESRPLVPLIHGGVNRIQPVFIGDLTEALVRAVTADTALKGTLELGGPDVVTMREFVEALMDVLGVRKPVIGLPGLFAYALALACERLQPVPLLSCDQVTMASEDSVCEDNALTSVFGITPTSLKAALDSYRLSLSGETLAGAVRGG